MCLTSMVVGLLASQTLTVLIKVVTICVQRIHAIESTDPAVHLHVVIVLLHVRIASATAYGFVPFATEIQTERHCPDSSHVLEPSPRTRLFLMFATESTNTTSSVDTTLRAKQVVPPVQNELFNLIIGLSSFASQTTVFYRR